MTILDGGWVPKGWQCPVCKMVYAPGWPFCTNCGGEKVVTADRVTVGDTPGNMHETRTVTDETGRLKTLEAYTLVMPVEKQPKKTEMTAEDIPGLYCDDISFCLMECGRKSCPRNRVNIRDHTIPHSFSKEVPKDCPKRGKA